MVRGEFKEKGLVRKSLRQNDRRPSGLRRAGGGGLYRGRLPYFPLTTRLGRCPLLFLSFFLFQVFVEKFFDLNDRVSCGHLSVTRFSL
jgi:hypothetical protein